MKAYRKKLNLFSRNNWLIQIRNLPQSLRWANEISSEFTAKNYFVEIWLTPKLYLRQIVRHSNKT